jgi:type II secretory pathway pseudopilin PulG
VPAVSTSDPRVCPRCGAPAGEHKYCPTCGLHLEDLDKVPTRGEWDAGQRWTDDGGSSEGGQRRGRLRRIVLLIAVAVLGAGAAAVVLVASGGNDDGGSSERRAASADRSTDSDRTSQDRASGPPEEQRCVDLWNADTRENNLPGGYVDTATGSVSSARDLYVSVGFADDFPDKCLVTVVGSATGTAIQFTETSEAGPAGLGHWSLPRTGNSSTVPQGAKDFNATVDDDGIITLDAD